MSTDPAVAAARRAWYARYGTPAPTVYGLFDLATAAAREALAPIRARHYPVLYACGDGRTKTVCAHCHRRGPFTLEPEPGDWPCDTARLAYSPEELTP